MLFYIKGKLVLKGEDFLVIDFNGIGFKVFVSNKTLNNSQLNSEIEVFTEHFIKHEEQIEIYGFLTNQELELFQFLKKISGIGPKAALNLSVAGSFDLLQEKLASGDKELMSNLKGIGQKKIQRILLELENKTKNKMDLKKTPEGDKEIIESLSALGFSKEDVLNALQKVDPSISNNEQKTKEVLKILGSNK